MPSKVWFITGTSRGFQFPLHRWGFDRSFDRTRQSVPSVEFVLDGGSRLSLTPERTVDVPESRRTEAQNDYSIAIKHTNLQNLAFAKTDTMRFFSFNPPDRERES